MNRHLNRHFISGICLGASVCVLHFQLLLNNLNRTLHIMPFPFTRLLGEKWAESDYFSGRNTDFDIWIMEKDCDTYKKDMQATRDAYDQTMRRLKSSMVALGPSPYGLSGEQHNESGYSSAKDGRNSHADRTTSTVAHEFSDERDASVKQEDIHSPVAGQNWTSPTTGMEFVWIPQMNLWVGKHEVTNAEYRRKEPAHTTREFRRHTLNGDRQPVVQVNFDDGKTYAEWLTRQDAAALGGARYRLPTGDEWTTFAQCGDGREYPWGNEWPPRSGHAGNYHGQEGAGGWSKIAGYNDGFPVTAPVDDLWENPWRLKGVGGNVWEATSKTVGGDFDAWRGASWSNPIQDYLLCTYRNVSDGSDRPFFYGFRLVLSHP